MSEMKNPAETARKMNQASDLKQEFSSSEKACLARIDKVREETVQEKDHLSAALTYFAATNMEIDLQYLHEVRALLGSRTQALHDMPEVSQLLATHFGSSRDYCRDLDLAQRYKQSKQKGDGDLGPRPAQPGFKTAEKPR